MMAWDDDVGSPTYRVMRSQAMAPMRAAATIAWVVVW
jgi:hypothetical protein